MPLPSMSKQQSQESNSTHLQPVTIPPPSEVSVFLPQSCHLSSSLLYLSFPGCETLSSGRYRPGEGGDAVWPLSWEWGWAASALLREIGAKLLSCF